MTTETLKGSPWRLDLGPFVLAETSLLQSGTIRETEGGLANLKLPIQNWTRTDLSLGAEFRAAAQGYEFFARSYLAKNLTGRQEIDLGFQFDENKERIQSDETDDILYGATLGANVQLNESLSLAAEFGSKTNDDIRNISVGFMATYKIPVPAVFVERPPLPEIVFIEGSPELTPESSEEVRDFVEKLSLATKKYKKMTIRFRVESSTSNVLDPNSLVVARATNIYRLLKSNSKARIPKSALKVEEARVDEVRIKVIPSDYTALKAIERRREIVDVSFEEWMADQGVTVYNVVQSSVSIEYADEPVEQIRKIELYDNWKMQEGFNNLSMPLPRFIMPKIAAPIDEPTPMPEAVSVSSQTMTKPAVSKSSATKTVRAVQRRSARRTRPVARSSAPAVSVEPTPSASSATVSVQPTQRIRRISVNNVPIINFSADQDINEVLAPPSTSILKM
jgi:hypothetical protein